MKNQFSIRDKAILIGLYLSKFDEKALRELDFNGSREAFNVLGYGIGSKPASIKNYRDEFDPYFPNPRMGWHKRPIRAYCKKFLDDFGALSFSEFSALVKDLLVQNYNVEQFVKQLEKKDYSESIAKRLVTGSAAEEYFRSNYTSIDPFAQYRLTDTTQMACGFDFKLSLASDFYCVEVKGLNALSGSISLTEKEFRVADELKDRYCLFVVSNFIDKPAHQLFFAPLSGNLAFKKVERKVIQTTYAATV